MGKITETIENVYRFFFLRKYAYGLNELLFQLSIRGLGIMNYENEKLSGEESFLQSICKKYENLTCLDIGANVGKYSSKIKQFNPQATVYAFEPHFKTFIQLEENAKKHNYKVFNIGLGDKYGKLKLYDYKDNSGSTHASLYKAVIEDIHKQESTCFTVDIDTIDNFADSYKIEHINLLKIDVEGHELNAIYGASNLINERKIDIIHFEFNEMNIVSGTFLKDIIVQLPNYKIFRMLPYGLVELKYSPLCEIFAYQNIVAIRNNIDMKSLKTITFH